jgi:tetratricopeptide (TPR) repeat protein
MKSLATGLVLVFLTGAVFAARTPSTPQMRSPQEQAMDFYSSGSRRLDKIAKLHEELTAKPAEAEKINQRMTKELEKAVADFKRATSYDPNMFQAHSELGFALRKLGRFDESLAAYDRALQIQPAFGPAIEYRAEAYLGLNRIDEAKEAYTILFSGDRERADQLLSAMKNWVDQRKTDAAGAPQQQIDDFSKWVEQRQTIHRQTGALTSSGSKIRTW